MSDDAPFWETKSLDEMTRAEWESLCDGCGLCCLVRFEDDDSCEVVPARVHCKLFDPETCRCSDYPGRKAKVPDCVQLSPQNVGELPWIPGSCAYRRLHEGRGLAWWHPLVSGDPETVHTAGVSIRNETISEESLRDEEEALEYLAPDLISERGL